MMRRSAMSHGGMRTGGKKGPPTKRFSLEVVAMEFLEGSTYKAYWQHQHELGLSVLGKVAYQAVEQQIVKAQEQV
jgi:hypothetical protein